jgi:hypothetical protein
MGKGIVTREKQNKGAEPGKKRGLSIGIHKNSVKYNLH